MVCVRRWLRLWGSGFLMWRRRPQISIIVPFADNGEGRAPAWHWLRHFWRSHFPDAELIVGTDHGLPFSKSVAVNGAAKRARGRIFVIADADAYINPVVIQQCADRIDAALRSGKRLWFMPYDKLYRLSQGYTSKLLKTDPAAPYEIPSPPPPAWLDPNPDPSGGRGCDYGHQYGAMCMVMPRQAFAAVRGFDKRFRGWGCCDEQTEILTQSGWRSHDQVAVGDEVMTLNHETGLSEWNAIQKVNIFSEPDGFKMLSAESKTHSSLTTLNHRWPVIKRNGLRDWVTSESINSHDRIPIRADHVGLPLQRTYSDSLVELIAWLYTEGHLGSGGSVGIAQSRTVHPGYCAEIEDALSREFGPEFRLFSHEAATSLGDDPVSVRELAQATGASLGAVYLWCHKGKVYAEKRDNKWLINAEDAEFYAANWSRPAWWVSTGSDCAQYHLNAGAGRRLLAFAPNKVPSHEFILSLTREQLELFLATSMKGDGATAPPKGNRVGSAVFEQRDERAAEVFAFAAILAGRAVTVHKRGTNSRGKDRRELDYRMTVVNLKHRDVTAINAPGKGAAVPEIVHYDGIVWCPTTANGTWLARRNGKVYFTGNSEDASLLKALDTLYCQHEVVRSDIVHLWHVRPGFNWETRKWVGQNWTPANSRLAQRYQAATGEAAWMRALVDEHK
jgi:hypothetical protein